MFKGFGRFLTIIGVAMLTYVTGYIIGWAVGFSLPLGIAC